jgi:TetR/AcrR family transcriptional regulator of autoinduction and epiphytic fitness
MHLVCLYGEDVETLGDRRTLARARHREAILQAANELIRVKGSPSFSADELAVQADVARRTIFNHFASLDEIVTVASAQVLADAVEEIRSAATLSSPGDGSTASTFAAMARVFAGLDLTPTIAYLAGVLGGHESAWRTSHLIEDVFSRVTEVLTTAAKQGNEDDALGAEILVSSLMAGVTVIAQRWSEQTGCVVNDETRTLWFGFVERMLDQVGRGYVQQVPPLS